MAGVCRKVKVRAVPGDYELQVSGADSNVVVQGSHGKNGKVQDKWLNADLLNRTQTIAVAATERHQLIVVATFTQNATDTSKVTVRVVKGEQDVMDACVLTPKDKHMAVMSVITAA
jgi:hypothetical protein